MTRLASPVSLLRGSAVVLIAVSVAFAAGCGGSDKPASDGPSFTKETTPTKPSKKHDDKHKKHDKKSSKTASIAQGKQLFSSAGCVSCHTLADANASGRIGPNLDEEQPPRAEIIDKVTNGDGRMPAFADNLSPDQIAAVAAYISSVAGK